jgi:murein DD-endopeptidase MepM/ murein hydrolase activator NlpD
VIARVDEPLVEARVRLLGQSVPMQDLGDGLWRAFFGIAVEQEPGEWRIELLAKDGAGNLRQAEAEVAISATDFEQGGFIQLTEGQTVARQDQTAADESNDKRRRAYSADVAETRWIGTFERPAPGRRSSPFGKFRTYSDGRTKHHKGTDIAAPAGTPVKAPAGGIVTLAEELHIYGNAVIVKHGPRVSSSYNHLSTIGVAVGDVVEAGDVVGEVGSTGQSTGPHLHWGMVVGGVAVDAEQWSDRDFDAPLPGDFDGE